MNGDIFKNLFALQSLIYRCTAQDSIIWTFKHMPGDA